MKERKIYLTFDLEEFDIPNEFGGTLLWDEQIAVAREGMNYLLPVLLKHDVTATFFTTAAFALENVSLVKELSEKFEIASHSYWHSSFEEDDLKKSVETLEEITGKKVTGLRMPRMKQVDIELIKEAGFLYDSSINPINLPGRYNFSHMPRTAYTDNQLLRIPTSVTPGIRFPLFWLAFKNLPYWLYKKMAARTLYKDGYLNLYFHPWEFAELEGYKLPKYIKKLSGKKLANRLDRFLGDIKTSTVFCQMQDF